MITAKCNKKFCDTLLNKFCDVFSMERLNDIIDFHELTFEKHAPICTFGVGGSPLLIGLGGVCLFRSLLLGGTGGVSDNKSGLIFSLSRSADVSLSPK